MVELKKGIIIYSIPFGTKCVISEVLETASQKYYRIHSLENGDWHPGYFCVNDLIIYYKFENEVMQLLYGRQT